MSGLKNDKINKEFQKIFKSKGLNIVIQRNMHEEIFMQSKQYYQDALVISGYTYEIKYNPSVPPAWCPPPPLRYGGGGFRKLKKFPYHMGRASLYGEGKPIWGGGGGATINYGVNGGNIL